MIPRLKALKPYLRWVILGGMILFLLAALRNQWQEVMAIRITGAGWASGAIALGVTLMAHIWSGWVWSWILHDLKQPVTAAWSISTYLKTNIAKYLPGNVWHFYGRVWATHNAGVPLGVSTLSVVLEPLLMAAAALAIALLSSPQPNWILPLLSLILILGIVHPRVLNPPLLYLQRTKGRLTNRDASPAAPLGLNHYPLKPFLGELVFVILRGIGFVLTVQVLVPVQGYQVPLLFSAFGFAWLLGLVVPGAPGGLGVFEVTAIAILRQGNSGLPPAIILSAVAIYRLVSILAEAGGAGLVWLDEQRTGSDRPS
ncbi:MAG TPA: hypothetical protein V6D20_24190 [Candidatus Obscuribacterales bacterium]